MEFLCKTSKFCLEKFSWENQLGIFLPKLVGKVLLAMLGIFFQNVPVGNLFGTLAKFWNFYLGKLLFGSLCELMKSTISVNLVESWENFTWENFMWENLEFLIWENFVAHICWTKSWKTFIWKILNLWLGKFYLGKF